MTAQQRCKQCGQLMIRRDAGFLGWVWGCPDHTYEWAWGAPSNDPNTMERRAAIEAVTQRNPTDGRS